MSAPIVISSLPVLGTVLDSDSLLVRSGGTDYQATAASVRTINVNGLSPIPNGPQITDQMIVARGGQSYKASFNQVGFAAGTCMWFYGDGGSISDNWEIVSGLSDCLLSVSGGSTYLNGSMTGTWQQLDHTLTASEMNHAHYPFTNNNRGLLSSGGLSSYQAYIQEKPSAPTITANVTNPNSTVSATGHNHGNLWRPLAAGGLVRRKKT